MKFLFIIKDLHFFKINYFFHYNYGTKILQHHLCGYQKSHSFTKSLIRKMHREFFPYPQTHPLP